jgi:hypothetical protein
MSTGVEQGMWAWGSPEYVLGAQIGNAIGNEIRKQQFMKNCMIIKGWGQVPKGKKTASLTSTASARQRAEVAKAKALGQKFPPAPRCSTCRS